MSRGVKSRLIRPWNATWQRWAKGNKKDDVWQIDSEPGDAAPTGQFDLCAVPARNVVAVPLWIEAADEATVRESALLEVEMKGLASGERLAVDFAYKVIRREEQRTLILALVFPAEEPSVLKEIKAERYEPSPMLAGLGEDGVHLWKEFDDLVAVVKWEGQILCWETTQWTMNEKEIEIWLQCLLIPLCNQFSIPGGLPLKDWARAFTHLPEGFGRALTINDDERRDGPPLALPADASVWQPVGQREASRSRKQRALIVNTIAAVAGVVLVAVLAGTAFYMGVQIRMKEIDRKIQAMEPAVAPLRQIASTWSQVETSVDQRYFPLEILHLIVGAMPEKGVRLTAFTTSPESTIVAGDADNFQSATDFSAAVQKGSGELKITWEMPQPSLQADGKAHFVITGTRINE
jgi:hypothetical protein